MEFKIRKATKHDMKEVLELIKELATFEKEPGAVIIDENDLIRDGFGNTPSFSCLVGEINGHIEGMALFYFRYSTWKGKTVHLEDLIVREKFRGIGLGSGLYTAVIKFAAEEKVKRTEWVVLDWNKTAADFYQRSGAKVLESWDTVQMDAKAMHEYLEKKSPV